MVDHRINVAYGAEAVVPALTVRQNSGTALNSIRCEGPRACRADIDYAIMLMRQMRTYRGRVSSMICTAMASLPSASAACSSPTATRTFR